MDCIHDCRLSMFLSAIIDCVKTTNTDKRNKDINKGSNIFHYLKPGKSEQSGHAPLGACPAPVLMYGFPITRKIRFSV